MVMGTSLPIVAVISSSMEHPLGPDWQLQNALCGTVQCPQMDWYKERGISMAEFKNFSFSTGFNKGDIMIIIGKKPQNIQIGEVIVFKSGENYPIIHRVIRKFEVNGEIFFETKGDNNPAQIQDPASEIDEKNVPASSIYGIAVLRIPWIGYVKICATDLNSCKNGIFR